MKDNFYKKSKRKVKLIGKLRVKIEKLTRLQKKEKKLEKQIKQLTNEL